MTEVAQAAAQPQAKRLMEAAGAYMLAAYNLSTLPTLNQNSSPVIIHEFSRRVDGENVDLKKLDLSLKLNFTEEEIQKLPELAKSLAKAEREFSAAIGDIQGV